MGKMFRKGADEDRIDTWIALGVALATLALVWLGPLNWSILAWVALGVATGAFVRTLMRRRFRINRVIDLPFPLFMALCVWLPFPWSGALATALFLVFLALMRKALADAMLPVRAYFVRAKSQRQ